MEVEEYSRKMVDKDVTTDYFFVEDFVNEALESFQLSRKALGRGYYYSNHELVGIYLCDTDYLVFFTGDTWLDKKTDWIEPAFEEFEKSENYKVANLVWNRKDIEAKGDVLIRNKGLLCILWFFRSMLSSKNEGF